MNNLSQTQDGEKIVSLNKRTQDLKKSKKYMLKILKVYVDPTWHSVKTDKQNLYSWNTPLETYEGCNIDSLDKCRRWERDVRRLNMRRREGFQSMKEYLLKINLSTF